ncbi:MAG: VIT and VWA domain-containing protein [Pseudomonadota bacterium]
MKTRVLFVLTLVPLAFGAPAATPASARDADQAGQVTASIDGERVSLPMLKSDYAVAIDGTMATVTLKQTFFNSRDRALNATYLFPLNRKAAVYAMTMEVGDEVVEAVIKRKAEAQKTFDRAKADGKAASLLTQHRPNMFTQDIANLMPGASLTVTLKYVQPVPKVDGAYELVVPFVVGPRYEGKGSSVVADRSAPDADIDDVTFVPDDAGETEEVSGWSVAKLPDYPPVSGQDAPGAIDRERVGFSVALRAPVPIHGMMSPTHALAIETGDNSAQATLAKGRTIGNKDLVLRYELGEDDTVAAGILSHFDHRGGFVSLQIEPPKTPADDAITPRELVFVLDTSGSMSGKPMRASKTFMRAALKGLRPGDHFRILRFSNNTTQFAQDPVPATLPNVRAGIRFVDNLSAGGGTEMNKAINAAFDTRPLNNTMRIVVFLTDGYIGADRQVIQTVARRIGNARIYAFGVGKSVNRYLLEGLAEEGRGRARYVEIDEAASEAAEALAQSLDAPLLTDLEIDWNGLAVDAQSPARLPDLFAAGAVRVLARYEQGGAHRITVKGLINGRPASLPIDIILKNKPSTGDAPGESALPITWARERIFDLERAYTISGGKDKRAEQAITKLGLDFSLQTAFTSFVAVSTRVVNAEPGNSVDAAVPVPQVEGVSTRAYPSLNLSGSSAPEPEALFGLIAVLLLVLARFRKFVLCRLRRLM